MEVTFSSKIIGKPNWRIFDANIAQFRLIILIELDLFYIKGLTDAVLGDQPSLCVVSTGAECIMLHKKYFLSHAPEKLINKLKQQVSTFWIISLRNP